LMVSVPVWVVLIVSGFGVSVTPVPTVTVDTAVPSPGAVALTVSCPVELPVRRGWRVGVVLPALNETLVKFNEAEELLGVKVTVTFEVGGETRVTGKVTL